QPARDDAIGLLSGLSDHVEGFICNSDFYAEKMRTTLRIANTPMHRMPLAIDPTPFLDASDSTQNAKSDHPIVGYFARIAPEKGLHHLVDGFIELAKHEEHRHTRLHLAGWLGEHRREYLQQQQSRLDAAGLTGRHAYQGSPSLQEKVGLIREFDVLSVPTEYHEPKGRFVLEALACGVPVVQPDHGAFGELLRSTGGGILVAPNDPVALAEGLHRALTDDGLRRQLIANGKEAIQTSHHIRGAAQRLVQILSESA
ncbi:MAG: glycosyltransferase family 4 protein, partial [Planctomycetota bacterium]